MFSFNSQKVYPAISTIQVILKATIFRLFERIKVFCCYYTNLTFVRADLFWMVHYLFATPHRVSREFLKEKEKKDSFLYGETPLTTLDKICKECGLVSDDVVFELGCGAGRAALWLRAFVKCRVIGVDVVPTFIRRAKRVAQLARLEKIEFYEDYLQDVDLRRATAVYLYGTCLEDDVILKLIEQLKTLPHGAKIITVSFPLTEYCQTGEFKVLKDFPARFPWGKALVFFNCKVDALSRVPSGEFQTENSPRFSSNP